MRRWLLSLALVLAVPNVYGQGEDLDARDPRLNEGTLFTIKFVPGDKKILVSLAGKPQVELGPKQVVVLGREIMAGGKSKKLAIKPSDGNFLLEEPIKSKRAVEIEVRDRSNPKQKEIFRLNLN